MGEFSIGFVFFWVRCRNDLLIDLDDCKCWDF